MRTGCGTRRVQNDGVPVCAWYNGHEHADSRVGYWKDDFSVRGTAGDMEWGKPESEAGSGQWVCFCVLRDWAALLDSGEAEAAACLYMLAWLYGFPWGRQCMGN